MRRISYRSKKRKNPKFNAIEHYNHYKGKEKEETDIYSENINRNEYMFRDYEERKPIYNLHKKPRIEFANNSRIDGNSILNLLVVSNDTHKFIALINKTKHKHIINTNMAGTKTIIHNATLELFRKLADSNFVDSIVVIPIRK